MALRLLYSRSSHIMAGMRSYSISNKKLLDIVTNDATGFITVTMNRPPVNALNLGLLTELSETFKELDSCKPNGVILTSYSEKVYSAGLDLNEIIKPDPVKLKYFWGQLQNMVLNIYGASYPTVAVVNGHALAGGCALALCCEYRIMVENFTIGLNETHVGLPVPVWLIHLIQNVIGKRRSELAISTSEVFTTNEALQIGLIDETALNKSDGIHKAEKFLRRFETINQLARVVSKKRITQPIIEATMTTKEKEAQEYVGFLTSLEAQQSIENRLATTKIKKTNK